MAATTAPRDIDEYIAAFPIHVQRLLQEIRATIRRAAPEAKEAIKYQMPTFTLHGNLIHFAAFHNHIGIDPAPRDLDELRDELTPYAGTKSSPHLPLADSTKQ